MSPTCDEDDPVSGSCAPDKGTNRLYTISAYTGAPVFDRESSVDPDGDDDGDGVPNGSEDDDGDGTPNGSDDDDDGDGVPDSNDPDSVDDRDVELSQGGIAPEVVWLFPSPEDPQTCVGAECRPDPVCLVGLENCGVGINLESRPHLLAPDRRELMDRPGRASGRAPAGARNEVTA